MEISIDIPDDIYILLQKRAKENRRCLNDEILAILKKATRSYRKRLNSLEDKINFIRILL
ncbi:MAG: Arc family DNA-binding protein [Armatimonadetes bacterium]|nr:Arc family DNA-binding protein [Armatimonadota bacterium]